MKPSVKILYLEDNSRDVELVRDQLQQAAIACELRVVRDRAEYEAALIQTRYDLILSDYGLPDYDGLAAMMLARQKQPEVPFIIISGSLGEDRAVDCMLRGATDYVLKQRLERLVPAVTRALIEAEERRKRREAEESLCVSELRYRRLFEAARDGILILDAETGTVVDVNPFLIDLLCYSREAFLGKKVWELGFFKDIVANQANFAELQLKEYIHYEDMPLETSDGRRIEVEFVSHLYLVNHQKVIQCNIRDTTERKQLERQLLEAQKMEAIGHLAGGVAHDFNNILAVVSGYATLAAGKLDPEHPARKRLEPIIDAARRGAALTRQLLLFSRKQKSEPRVINLNEIIRDFDKMLRRLIGEGISLETRLDATLWNTMADPVQVEQVLMNLAVNARDAMDKGGTLTLETSNVESGDATPRLPGGKYALLSVSDTGCGIPEDIQGRIFEPLFTTKEVGKGTGLGLAVVQSVMHACGGHVELTSHPGHGTTFRLSFPRTDTVPAPRVATRATSSIRGSETILVVDDQMEMRAVMIEALETYGYQVLSARNAAEAMFLCGKRGADLDLLIADIAMPQMSGAQLAVSLRQMLPSLKVLFVSGYSRDTLIRHGIPEDAKNVIDKPFSPPELAAKVRSILDSR